MIEHCSCGSVLKQTSKKHRGYCLRCNMEVKTVSATVDSERTWELRQQGVRPYIELG